jgi:hypothetical protein
LGCVISQEFSVSSDGSQTPRGGAP